jgi:PcRGLX-like protein C-terminal alpha/alpha toroid domain/PcRGLX-like protein central beta sandwich domain/PcRGLX-like N-terminal RIFT barrel domain
MATMKIKQSALGWMLSVIGCALPASGQGVQLHWLDGSPPAVAQGVSWGVPWPAGKIQKEQTFALRDASGKDVAVQSWPLAYWPDGSIKWTGFAATGTSELGGKLEVVPGAAPGRPGNPVVVKETEHAIEIDNGASVWRIGRKGESLVQSIALNNQVVARDGRLVGQVEDRSQWESKQTVTVRDFVSEISSAVVEQSGPVRAVVKIEGKHRFTSGGRAWLPFVVRLYFYADSPSVRMVHTFIFDGDQAKDFIRGLGVRFDVPMREEFQNRHVRLAGDDGFFSEPVRLIVGRRNPDPAMYVRQLAGKRIPNLDQLPLPQNVREMAVWNDYKLTQLTPDGFNIEKRTNPQSAWIRALGGRRARGMAFVGDVSGGLAVDLKNFWRLYPTELEINNAGKDVAQLTVWLWSPEAPAMDMRHYDTVAHGLEASYEDVQPGYSNAYGVARTSELTLRPYSDVPSDEDLWREAQADQRGTLLVCSPEYYHAIPIFGLWSLPDRSTAEGRRLEGQLDRAISFYQGQVEQRRWYGFWDFGDVMHTYDTPRHEWRYDVGGFAWDNTELAPNLWLWYSFLRSGRADVYRMAEALTRQSQEVDVYHIGPWKGLGSRHNVRHWGDGAKELRISQCLFKRFYYYLTTDERTGDLMNEEIDADKSLLAVDPLRELPGISEDHKYPTHVRIGPDWLALVSNWYTAWERTGDVKYRDWILAGMKSITAMPGGIASGENYGYDPKTRTLHQLTNDGRTPSLLPLFGGPELMTEIIPIMHDPAWTAAWLDYCQKHARHEPDNARLTAYGAYMTKSADEGTRAWQQLMKFPMQFDSQVVSGPVVAEMVDEIDNVSTNATAQWCLNVIELLQTVPNQLPGK